MTTSPIHIERPARWDEPFDPDLTPEDVQELLETAPFNAMDPSRFSASSPLEGILANDVRIRTCQAGEVVTREGDYANSAFLLLDGEVRVVLQPSLPATLLGRSEKSGKKRLGSFWDWMRNSPVPEGRDVRTYNKQERLLGKSGILSGDHILLQGFPVVLQAHKTARLRSGELFGEIAAVNRMPQPATVIADSDDTRLLEIRWQGLREFIRRDPAFQERLDESYRQRALKPFLRTHPLFSSCSEAGLNQLVEQTVFETFGDYDWSGAYKDLTSADRRKGLDAEPVIAEEGHYANDLIMVRAGFARISQRRGKGRRTLAYLGTGRMFGLEEIQENLASDQAADSRPYQSTLQAVGYTHVLRIPAHLLQDPAIAEAINRTRADTTADPEQTVGAGVLEFIGERRFLNGTATMLINLDRCTRCDDCVRACAGAHDNNPRFLRNGPVVNHIMVANACMHCNDPVCMIGCPTGAIHRSEPDGQIVVNDTTCIGCGTCAGNCPYEAIRMVEVRDRKSGAVVTGPDDRPIVKATKCDLCASHAGGPACERACPHDALYRADMDNLLKIRERMRL